MQLRAELPLWWWRARVTRTPAVWLRVLRGLFVAYAAATALHIGWVVAHEPFTFDAWNVAVDTDAKPITLGRFFDYWWFEYTHSNPRFGQALTYLSYKLEYFSVIATPIAYLAVSLAITVLGLRRWPWWRDRDLALWSIVLGSIWFSLPQIGKTLFCRAYCANYIYGLAIQLWFVVWLHLAKTGVKPGFARCIGFGALGVIAGMCNEHTGPTLCVYLIGYALWFQRQRDAKANFAWAGAVGVTLGFAAIFFAPGQGERYGGLAQRASLVGRMLQRGVTGNVEIVRDLILGVAPILGLIGIVAAIALSRREPLSYDREAVRIAMRRTGLVAAAAFAMAATLFVSPKLGPRFYYGSACLLLACFVALAGGALTARQLAPFVVFAVASSIYAVGHTVPLYGRLARASETRLAALAVAPPGSVYVAKGFEQIDESWWSYGDDMRDAKKRNMVATYFGLSGLAFDAFDPFAPLGVTRAAFAADYKIAGAPTVDQEAGLVIGKVAGFDMIGLQHEAQTATELLRTRLQPAKVEQVDVTVIVDHPRVHLPRSRVLISRWREGQYESYIAQIHRKGRTTARTIALPKQLVNTDYEIVVYNVGGEQRRLGGTHGEPLQYAPWSPGIYWLLACRSQECFVIAATRSGGG